jgi:hypothetical protein
MTDVATQIATGTITREMHIQLCAQIDANYPASDCEGFIITALVSPGIDDLLARFSGVALTIPQLDAEIAAFVYVPPGVVALGTPTIADGIGGLTFGSIALTDTTGTLALNRGGTGATTQVGAANAVLPSQTTNANKHLFTDGTNASWSLISLASSITGTLPIANGGTGLTSPGAAGQVLRSDGSVWTSAALGATDVSAVAGDLIGASTQAQLNNAGARIVALESAAIGASLLKWGFAARVVGEEFGPAGSAGESGATATTSGAGAAITANPGLALNDYIIGVSRMTSGTSSTGTATLSWATNTFNFTPRSFGDILVFTIVRMSALLVTNEISFGLGATFTGGATASAGLIARCIGNDNWVLDYRAAGISQASSASTTPLSIALVPRVVGILLTSSGASLYETALPTVPSAQGLVRSPAYIAATLLATPSIASLTNVQLAATPPGQIGGFVRIRNSGATASTNLDCAAFYQLAA